MVVFLEFRFLGLFTRLRFDFFVFVLKVFWLILGESGIYCKRLLRVVGRYLGMLLFGFRVIR